MASITHASASINAAVTTTSTSFVDVPGVTLNSGNFVVGKKYLIAVTSNVWIPTSDHAEFQLVHGSTTFTGSKEWVSFLAANQKTHYSYVTVWTAVSGEGVAFQFRSRLGTNAASANFSQLFVMNLTDNLVENVDWFYNENTTPVAMSTTFADGASVTFTPATTNHDWLIWGTMSADYAAQTTNTVLMRLNRDADAEILPSSNVDAINSALNTMLFGLSRVYTLTNASHTLKVQHSVSASTTANHLSSTIFALNLNKFKQHNFVYNEASNALSATDYATNLATIALTPNPSTDVWIGAYWDFDLNANHTSKERIQVDSVDAPTGQTAALHTFERGPDPLDEPQMITTLVTGMTSAAHTINLDASVEATTSVPAGRYITLWAVTMELATIAPVRVPLRYTLRPV